MQTAVVLAAALAAHAPVVVHDSRERFPVASVASSPTPVPGLDPDPRVAVYGRTAPSKDNGVWLQYWLFYPWQDQDRGIVRSGRHAGDWEMVQFRLNGDGVPTQAVYAQHAVAERCGWGAVEQRGGRPVVYVARGAHGSYVRPGTRDRMWPDPNDEADGRGAVVRPRLVQVTAAEPSWMRWQGRWGGARARWWIPPEQDSPRGPAFQEQGRWSDPDRWAADATPCRAACDRVDECDGAEEAMGAAAGGVAALLAFGAVVMRRRRRRSA